MVLMENLGFTVLALLPLGLLNWRRDWKWSDANIFGLALAPFLKLIAPVVASGVSSLVGHKQAKSKEKKEAEFARQEALAAEAARKSQFEASQNDPRALAQRQSFTMQLGKLLGKAGGKEKIPPSIYNYLSSQRQAQQYTPGAAYTPKPTSGAGIWDFAGGLGNALSYLDTTKLGRTPNIAENLARQGQGLQAARQGGLGALQGGGMATSIQPGPLNRLLRPQPSDRPPGF
jgi:hypothetical protein